MRAANPSQALARVLVDEFARAGLAHLVLAPGSRSAALALAAHEHPAVRVHVEIDERSAGFLALGIGRASGRPAGVLTTSGTAAANLHPAILEADAARVPLLALTADRPPELRQTGANQTVDQMKLFGDAVRWFVEVGVSEARAGVVGYWRSLASGAWAHAIGAPPGPVHLNLAFREPLVPVADGSWPPDLALDGRAEDAPWTAVHPPTIAPSPSGLAALRSRLVAARRPLLVLGDALGELRPLAALAERCNWPLLAEPQSGARSGPAAISTYDLLLRSAAFADAHRPDLALIAGRAGLSRPLLAWLEPAIPQVRIDPYGGWLDPGRSAGDVLVAEPAAVADALADVAAADPAWLGTWQEAEQRARAVVDAVLDADDTPSEPRTARDLAVCLPDGSALVVASSMPVRDLNTFMPPRGGLRVIGNRGASGIDGFVSTALGVALAHPGPTAALAGDLSLLHDASGLLLADRPDLVLVVLNNNGGGIFSLLPQAAFADSFEPLFGTPHGIDVGALAAAYRCRHTRVERAAELVGAVERAREAGGVWLVEVRTDRAANAALHRHLAGLVTHALP